MTGCLNDEDDNVSLKCGGEMLLSSIWSETAENGRWRYDEILLIW